MGTIPCDTPQASRTETLFHPVSYLAECIDRIMPVALQITLDKNKEPTFYNVLDVISSLCNDWFLALKSTGTFAELSAGWTFVRHTDIVITNNSVMDEAVLHSLRSLSSFTKGVELRDLCSYISAAFRFPKALLSEQISEMVQCSANSLKVWGKVVIDNGHYQLPPEESTADGRAATVSNAEPSQAKTCDTPSALPSDGPADRVPAEHVPLPVHDITNAKTVSIEREFSEVKNDANVSIISDKEISAEKVNAVLDPDQVSITFTAGSPKQDVPRKVPRKLIYVDETDNEIGEPFLFDNKYYKLFVLYLDRGRIPYQKLDAPRGKKAVRALFEKHHLQCLFVHVAPSNTRMTFVEISDVEEGYKAIKLLNSSLQENGAFKLKVHWARANPRDVHFARLKAGEDNSRFDVVSNNRQDRSPVRPHRQRSLSRERRRSPARPDVRHRRSASPVRTRQRVKRSRSRSPSPRDSGYKSSRPSSVPDRESRRSMDRGYGKNHSPTRNPNYIAPIELSPFEYCTTQINPSYCTSHAPPMGRMTDLSVKESRGQMDGIKIRGMSSKEGTNPTGRRTEETTRRKSALLRRDIVGMTDRVMETFDKFRVMETFDKLQELLRYEFPSSRLDIVTYQSSGDWLGAWRNVMEVITPYTSSKMASEELLRRASLLSAGIDKMMPIALQITLQKCIEPTFYNVLDTIAACCNEWHLALRSTGTFVQLSTGWRFVRQTNTVITDNSVMDEAVLHSLRDLSSFTKGVELPDLCSYLTVAFRFPKVLSPAQLYAMVQCSVNSLQVWNKILIDNGQYKLPKDISSADTLQQQAESTKRDIPTAATLSLTSTNPQPRIGSVTSATLKPPQENRTLKVACESFGMATSETGTSEHSLGNGSEKIDPVFNSDRVSITSDQISITSAAGSPQPPKIAQKSSGVNRDKGTPRRGKNEPFLLANNCYRLYILFVARTVKKIRLGSGAPVRELLKIHDLRCSEIYIPPSKANMAFVEIEDLQDASKAIELLNGSLYDDGAFSLTVQWARPTERDHDDLRHARRTANSRSNSVSGKRQAQPDSETRDRRSLSRIRKRRTRSRSSSPRTKRRRSRSRSRRRRSRSRSRATLRNRIWASPIRRRSRSRSRPARGRFRPDSPLSDTPSPRHPVSSIPESLTNPPVVVPLLVPPAGPLPLQKHNTLPYMGRRQMD